MARRHGTTSEYMKAKNHAFRVILAAENGTALTDEQIAQKLTQQGFPTGDRRVFKMRQMFDIPNSYRRGK